MTHAGKGTRLYGGRQKGGKTHGKGEATAGAKHTVTGTKHTVTGIGAVRAWEWDQKVPKGVCPN